MLVVFGTDLLDPRPPSIDSNDSAEASDHLPVLIVFNNPFLASFRLTSITQTNQTVSLSWESVPGQSCQVENSQDAAHWSPFADTRPALNTTMTLTTKVASSSQFFRIRLSN